MSTDKKTRSPEERLSYYLDLVPNVVERLNYWQSYTDVHISYDEQKVLIDHYRRKLDYAKMRIEKLRSQLDNPQEFDGELGKTLRNRR